MEIVNCSSIVDFIQIIFIILFSAITVFCDCVLIGYCMRRLVEQSDGIIIVF